MEKEIDRKVEKTLQEEIEKLREIDRRTDDYFVSREYRWTKVDTFIEYLKFFKPKDIYKFLSELDESAKNRKHSLNEELDSMYYRKKEAREHLLKNFHETFGTIEKPISDAENRTKNCDSFPYLFSILYSVTFFSKDKVRERKLTKSEFDKIMETACSFEGLRELMEYHEGDKQASSMFEAYEEWKNIPYQDSNNNSFQ